MARAWVDLSEERELVLAGRLHNPTTVCGVLAAAVDAFGNVFANSEDGRVYQIGQGGVLKTQTFLNQALGAAYTPVALDPAGRVYALNNGELTVFGR